jgi:hypothetical protein
MTGRFKKSKRMISKTTQPAIFSPELGCGTTPLTSHDGRKIIGFGQEVAPANRLVQQVDKKVRQTIGTYGPNGCASLNSVRLQRSLENKCQMRFPKGGLTMFIKGWKRKTTPLGRLYCQLAVSVRPISGTDCGLWHTPRTVMIEETPENFRARMNSKRKNDRKDGLPNLAVQALWATPNTMDSMKSRSLEALAMAKTKGGCSNLKDQIHPALWATPRVRDHKDTGNLESSQFRKDGKERNDTLGRQAYGLIAPTERKGSLNPVFVFWLMGIPNAWVSSIVRGMQSCRKSPQSL